MPDRIIRDELLDSEKWLSLKDNADRLAFIALLLRADSLGNFSAEPFRLMRLWRDFGVNTPALVAKTLSELSDHDLIRPYEADGKLLLHIPRFGQRLRHLTRVFPQSPWTTNEQKQKLANNSPVPSPSKDGRASAEGKGSEEVPPPVPRKKRAPPETDAGLEIRREVWIAYGTAFQTRYGTPPPDGKKARTFIKNFCEQLQADECAKVAAYYLTHNGSFYVLKGHSLQLLAADAAKLRTEWATNHQITQTEAYQADKRQSNKGVFSKLIEEAKIEAKH